MKACIYTFGFQQSNIYGISFGISDETKIVNTLLKYGIFSIMLFPCSSLTGQEKFNLDNCIRYGLENNLSLKDQEYNYEIQYLRMKDARNQRLPGFSAGVGLNEGFGRSINPGTNTYDNVNYLNNSYSINTSVNLFNGFKISSRIAFERFSMLAEKNLLEYQKNQLVYNIIEAYYSLLLNQGLYSIYEENLQLSREQLFNIQKLIEVGRKAESDIYELQAKMATDSFSLVQQEGDKQKALLNLKMLMHFPFNDSLNIDTIQNFTMITPQDSISVNKLKESGLKSMLDVQVTSNRLEAARKQMAEARGNFSPSLSAYAGWQTNFTDTKGTKDSTFRDQFRNHAGENIGLSLSIPLFYNFEKINAFKTARLNYKKAQISHQLEMQKFENEMNKAYIDWQSGKNEFAAAQKQLDKSKIAFETAKEKLLIGQLNIIDYDIQKNEFLKGRMEVLRTSLQLMLQERYIRFILTGNWQLSE